MTDTKSIIEEELENWKGINAPMDKEIRNRVNSAIQKALEELKKKGICFECHCYPCDVTCPMQGNQDALFVSDVEKCFEVKDDDFMF